MDWSDFSSLDSSTDVPVTLTEQSIALLLSALEFLENRRTWGNPDDSTYDEIQQALASVYEQLSE